MISSQNLVQQFYNQLDKEYKSKYTFHEVRQCVFYPWKKASQSIFRGDLVMVRMKYFGSFQIFYNRIKYLLTKELGKEIQNQEKIEKYEKFIKEH